MLSDSSRFVQFASENRVTYATNAQPLDLQRVFVLLCFETGSTSHGSKQSRTGTPFLGSPDYMMDLFAQILVELQMIRNKRVSTIRSICAGWSRTRFGMVKHSVTLWYSSVSPAALRTSTMKRDGATSYTFVEQVWSQACDTWHVEILSIWKATMS